jgi:HSP20 family protein
MLMRFDPFAEFDRLNREVWGGRATAMPVDAYKLGDRFYLHFDLPGIDPDSIDITVEKQTLTVSAERSWRPDEEATVLVSERPHGAITRRFFLGDGLNTDGIEAGYDHGVLTVMVPIAEQAKARKILVGASDKALTS